MHRVKSLPPELAARYRAWKETSFTENRESFERLAADGQRPGAMVVACCDSRVTVELLFGPNPGEIFVHRNIANVVPRHTPDGGHHGTAAAIEYAVTVLEVGHLIVMGHSQCGGVKGCMDMCDGHAPQLTSRDSYVGRWLEELRPAHTRVAAIKDMDQRVSAMEKESVHLSLENLMGYPFVRKAVDDGKLRLHGLWVDIANGMIESYDGDMNAFSPM